MTRCCHVLQINDVGIEIFEKNFKVNLYFKIYCSIQIEFLSKESLILFVYQ